MTVGELYRPRPIAVDAEGGIPELVAGARVESVRERWLVEDRWWSSEPLRRNYFEVVLTTGRCTVVFCDLVTRSWYEQR